MAVDTLSIGSTFSALSSIGVGAVVVDEAGIIVDANDVYCAMVDGDATTLKGSPFVQALPEPVREAALEFHRQVFAFSGPRAREQSLRRGDGRMVRVRASSEAWTCPEGRSYRITVVQDMSGVDAAFSAAERLALAEMVFKNSSEGILVTDCDSHILSVNPAFLRITGYQESELIGATPRIFKSGWQNEAFYSSMMESLEREGVWRGELWDRRKDGTLYAQWTSISRVLDESGALKNYVEMINEITDQKRADEQIRYLAYYDTLTDLPNRTLLFDRLSHAIESSRTEGAKIGLLFIDLDRFKAVNDGFGPEGGDRLLKDVALRLRSVVKTSDTVARLGGDEFAILLEGIQDGQDAALVAEHALSSLSAPFRISGGEVFLSASVGIAIYPVDGEHLEALIRNADAAMYQAKAEGRNAFRFYRSELNARVREHIRIESRLRHSIEEESLRLFYQPQVSLVDNRIVGWEALLRWEPADLGPVSPALFIPLAEETDLIVPIGSWVLRQALTQYAESGLGAPFPEGQAPTLAVNLSARQFTNPHLLGEIESLLRETEVDGGRLEIEITESAVMRDVESSIRILKGIKDLGVRVAVDDFGTGYSSLSYLKRFPIDKLKVDRSFVLGLPDSAEDAAIANTILALARALGMRTIAEGIETEAQRSFFAERGCDEYQGYLFSKAVPLDEAVSLLQAPQRNLRP